MPQTKKDSSVYESNSDQLYKNNKISRIPLRKNIENEFYNCKANQIGKNSVFIYNTKRDFIKYRKVPLINFTVIKFQFFCTIETLGTFVPEKYFIFNHLSA